MRDFQYEVIIALRERLKLIFLLVLCVLILTPKGYCDEEATKSRIISTKPYILIAQNDFGQMPQSNWRYQGSQNNQRTQQQQARQQQARQQQARERQARQQQARERQARQQQARERQARQQQAREQLARERRQKAYNAVDKATFGTLSDGVNAVKRSYQVGKNMGDSGFSRNSLKEAGMAVVVGTAINAGGKFKKAAKGAKKIFSEARKVRTSKTANERIQYNPETKQTLKKYGGKGDQWPDPQQTKLQQKNMPHKEQQKVFNEEKKAFPDKISNFFSRLWN